jgi:NADH pyrophosphatase NudC (nudix superfamily)
MWGQSLKPGNTSQAQERVALLTQENAQLRAEILNVTAETKTAYYKVVQALRQIEVIEQALVREVMEETGVEVLSAHYHSSQPWPFPGSLMLGYSAQAGSEKISLNDQELEHACWLDRDEITSRMQQGLFVLPPPISISFRLIEDWFDQHSTIPLRKLREDTGATHF